MIRWLEVITTRDDFSETRPRILHAAFLALLMLCAVAPVRAQQPKEANPDSIKEQDRSIADSHSFMELFTKLENQWTQAVQKRDRSALEALLAPEFNVQTAEDPQHQVTREKWISNALSGPEIKSFDHNTMAIRAFMGVAIVSFSQQEQQKVNGKVRTVRSFVVDVWEVDHHHWLAAERFLFLVDGMPPAAHDAEGQLR